MAASTLLNVDLSFLAVHSSVCLLAPALFNATCWGQSASQRADVSSHPSADLGAAHAGATRMIGCGACIY